MNENNTLKSLPEEERPRERLKKWGADAISCAELLAILLGSGIKGKTALDLANEMICHFGSLEQLSEATLEELCQIKGLGFAKAIKLKAAFNLASRLKNPQYSAKYKLEKPKDAFFLLRNFVQRQTQEILITILLDVRGFLIRWEIVAIGTLTQILVHPREVFYPAIRHKASSMILIHNHPSGDPTPSSQDIKITQLLIEASHFISIPIQDHIILTDARFFSFKEENVLSFT